MMKSLLTATTMLALTAPALAQTSGQMNSADQRFAHEAASGGKAEVELGRYVAEHGQNADVRAFGQRMVTDHTAANSKLERVAGGTGMQLPTELNDKDGDTVTKLEKLKGSQLDREYIHGMVQDHRKDIQAFQTEAQSGSDPQLKTFAQQTLPTLQQHLQMAEQVESKLGSNRTDTDHMGVRNDVRASKIMGSTVYNEQNQSIGTVDDILMMHDQKQPSQAVISVGGFLGIGSKLVQVPWDRLQLAENNKVVMPNATRDELNNMPGFTYSALEHSGGTNASGGTGVGAAGSSSTGSGMVSTSGAGSTTGSAKHP